MLCFCILLCTSMYDFFEIVIDNKVYSIILYNETVVDTYHLTESIN